MGPRVPWSSGLIEVVLGPGLVGSPTPPWKVDGFLGFCLQAAPHSDVLLESCVSGVEGSSPLLHLGSPILTAQRPHELQVTVSSLHHPSLGQRTR